MAKWYEEVKPQEDIVISTRIRLARNLKSFPFKEKMTQKQRVELNERVKNVLSTANLGNNHFDYLYMQEMSEPERISLVERHLVSRSFAEHAGEKLLILSQDESVSIMVNEEDHLRIQVLSAGMDLESTYELCSRIDDLLDEQLDYAFDEELGYLTVCPTNIGTGLRASVMLHLPALTRTGAMSAIIKTVGRLGLTIRGTYGEGTRATGCIYQLSNQVTLGLKEETAIENLQNVVNQIIAAEKSAGKEILTDNIELEDEIFKSYGFLKYARLLTTADFDQHISNLRLGVSAGLIEGISMQTINKLYNKAYAATICVEDSKRYTPRERDIKRAELVRTVLG